jgi:hypothetical protein
MKNNTASNKLGRLITTARFEAITGVELNAQTLYRAMTQGCHDEDERFRDALRAAFRPFELTCDMRKNSTWEALAAAITTYDTLSTVETPLESLKTSSGALTSISITSSNATADKLPRRTESLTPAVLEQSTVTNHQLEDSDWRDRHLMQMAEWHPCFEEVERKFSFSTNVARVVLKEYAEILLSTSTDDSEDLLRHLHEEVVPYLANKLTCVVDDVWGCALAATIRPNSPVREFERLIGECKVATA